MIPLWTVVVIFVLVLLLLVALWRICVLEWKLDRAHDKIHMLENTDFERRRPL